MRVVVLCLRQHVHIVAEKSLKGGSNIRAYVFFALWRCFGSLLLRCFNLASVGALQSRNEG